MAKVIQMDSFDENALVNELAVLSARARVAFATASATRQIGNYERFARELGIKTEHCPREIMTHLWSDLLVMTVDRSAWSERLEKVMSLLPEEDEDWVISHALADDALSSLAYSIRCLLKPDAQEAAWAARRAYEAADQAAIRLLALQPGLPDTEMKILSHDCVQRELARQRNDLALLRAESIEETQRQALQSELLTEEEAVSLI